MQSFAKRGTDVPHSLAQHYERIPVHYKLCSSFLPISLTAFIAWIKHRGMGAAMGVGA
jgi:hypothetical protein